MECKGSGVRTLWAGGGKRPTEEVVELDAAGHPGAVLGEQLAAAAGQPVSRAWGGDARTGAGDGRRPATPAARSAAPSPSKSPTATAEPKLSPSSATPGTPGLFWVNSWLPLPVSPPADPGSRLTAPPRSAAP